MVKQNSAKHVFSPKNIYKSNFFTTPVKQESKPFFDTQESDEEIDIF